MKKRVYARRVSRYQKSQPHKRKRRKERHATERGHQETSREKERAALVTKRKKKNGMRGRPKNSHAIPIWGGDSSIWRGGGYKGGAGRNWSNVVKERKLVLGSKKKKTHGSEQGLESKWSGLSPYISFRPFGKGGDPGLG